MLLKEIRTDLTIEVQILSAMVISDEFMNSIGQNIKPIWFESPYIQTVSKWILQYYKHHKNAPKMTIKDIFNTKVSSNDIDEKEADLIEPVINKIIEYAVILPDFNHEYHIRTAREYFIGRQHTIKAQKIDELIKNGQITEADLVFNNPIDYFEIPYPSFDDSRITREYLETAKHTPRCIVQGLLYADVRDLNAPGGTGKTTLILWEFIHIVLSMPLYGLEVVTPGKCFYITAEDSKEILTGRLCRLCDGLNLTEAEIDQVIQNIEIFDVRGEGAKLVRYDGRNIVSTKFVDFIIERFKGNPPVRIVFDPYVSFGAGENAVNDNEQAIIEAERKIIRALDCCVDNVKHTGKLNARSKELDQYAGRGGSASPDGARMVSTMATWQQGDRLKLPRDMTAEQGDTILIMSRPKLSFERWGLPHIWIKRRGWEFSWHIEKSVTNEQEMKEIKDTILVTLSDEIGKGHYHNKTSLLSLINQPRKRARDAFEQLVSEGQIVEIRLPKNKCQGGRKTYLDFRQSTAE